LGQWAILVPIALVLALLATQVRQAPNGFAAAFAAARRMIAFRADRAGITLGAVPGNPRGGRAAVLVPWADIQQIILYPVNPAGRGRYAQVRCIGIQGRPGGPRCPRATSRPRLPGAGRSQRRDSQDPRLAAGPRAPGRRDRGGSSGHPHQRLHWRTRSGS
jgi:hypothetical protein